MTAARPLSCVEASMAKRCLYCGGSSWQPFRWLRDQDFCSNQHRELYRARLQKVVLGLTSGADAADGTAASHRADRVLGSGDSLPIHTPGSRAVPAEVRMAPAIVVSDRAMAQEVTKILHLEKEAPTTVWLPPDIFRSGLQPREGQTCPQISPPIARISGAGTRVPIRHSAESLPTA